VADQPEPAEETIGKRLRRLRLERGLSQREISGPGVSYAYVSRIEAGHRDPSDKAIRLLARKLGVSKEHLATGQELPTARELDSRVTDAELALRLDPSADSIEDFRALLRDAREEGDDLVTLRCRIGLGLALAHQGQYAAAVHHLELATEHPAVTPLSHPDAFATLGRAYASAGEFGKAVESFEQCLALLRLRAPHEHGPIVRFASYLSCALSDSGDFKRARAVLLDIYAEEDLDDRGRANVYWSLARNESMAGDGLTALTHMKRALTILEASEDRLEIARGHLTCAEILLLDGEPEEAARHLAKAEGYFGSGADASDYGLLRMHQSREALLRGEAQEAIGLARRALEFVKEHALRQGSVWHVLGSAQAAAGDLDAALESFKRAVELLEGSGEWREATAVYREWAQALRATRREKEALDVMERASLVVVRSIGAQAREGRA
jgi:tetratricopeptide (TPR) repeat protein